jgi:hypothetical protein
MYNRKLGWDKAASGDSSKGDLSQASLTSEWASINGKPFAITLVNTAAGSPQGTWSFEVTSDGGANADAIDTTLMVPAPTNPDGTTTGQHQTLTFPEGLGHQVRVKYTRTGGGTGDNVQARVVRQ